MMLEDRDCLVVDETNNPTGASPNRYDRAARSVAGRTLS